MSSLRGLFKIFRAIHSTRVVEALLGSCNGFQFHIIMIINVITFCCSRGTASKEDGGPIKDEKFVIPAADPDLIEL